MLIALRKYNKIVKEWDSQKDFTNDVLEEMANGKIGEHCIKDFYDACAVKLYHDDSLSVTYGNTSIRYRENHVCINGNLALGLEHIANPSAKYEDLNFVKTLCKRFAIEARKHCCYVTFKNYFNRQNPQKNHIMIGITNASGKNCYKEYSAKSWHDFDLGYVAKRADFFQSIAW